MSKRKKGAVAKIAKDAGKLKVSVAAMVALQVVSGGCGVAFALILRGAVNCAAGGNSGGLWLNVILLVAAAAIILTCNAIYRYISELTKSGLENRLKIKLFGSLLFSYCEYVAARHSGEWLNLLSKDTEVVAESFAELLPRAVGYIVRLVCAAVFIALIKPFLFAVLAPAAALLVVFFALFKGALKKMYSEEREADGRVRVYMQERLIGLPVVRAYAVENAVAEGALKLAEEHRRARVRRNALASFCSFGFGAVMYGGYILCAAACGYSMLLGELDYGAFVALLQLVALAQSPIAGLAGCFPRYYALTVAASRLVEAEEGANFAKSKAVTERGVKNFEAFGLDNVSFGYMCGWIKAKGDKALALENVSLEIKRGEYVAIMGESGCGKSTALKLLIGLYAPTNGFAYVQCGKERVSPESLAGLFAYVPQGNYLISGTVKEVVTLADPEKAFDEERINFALRCACADEFVSEMEGGLNGATGERGASLSEGQAQRLAIARAIFSEREVLILDESTSALDLKTEEKLFKNLRALKNKTVVVVTHRKAVAAMCDRVITL